MNDDELSSSLGQAIEPPLPPVDPARLAEVRARAEQAVAEGPATRQLQVRSRRSVLGFGVAAAGGIAAGAAGAFLLTAQESEGPPLEAVAVQTTPGIEASASMIDHTWGLEVLLDVRGLEPGEAYEMTFIAVDGRAVPAGGFVGADTPMSCRNNGAVLRAETRRWVVTAPDGTEVIAADLA